MSELGARIYDPGMTANTTVSAVACAGWGC